MRGSIQRLLVPVAVLGAVVLLAGCSGARIADPSGADGFLPASGSTSDDLTSSLPPPMVLRNGASRPAPATPFVRTADEAVPPSWSTPAPVSAPTAGGYPYAAPATGGTPPPPPPPNYAGDRGAPVARYTAPTTTTYTYATAAPTAAVPLSQRCWSGCGLPCEDGISSWHVRLVGGWPLYEGTDTPEPCSYWGVDLGRTHCGCWGYDLYYRMSGAKFDREGYPDRITEDGGLTHHIGGKLTWETSIASSRFYVWTGLGAGYYFTSDYEEDSEGFEIYGELGVGYVLSQTFRVRVGLNVHGADTDTGRRYVADAGTDRWLWLIAPVAQLEVDF